MSISECRCIWVLSQLQKGCCTSMGEAAGSFSELNNLGKTFPKATPFSSSCTFLLMGRAGYCPYTEERRTWPLPQVTWSKCLAPSRVNEMRGEQQQANKSPWAWMCVLVCIPLVTAYLKKLIKLTYLSDTWTPASSHFLPLKPNSSIKQVLI